MQKEVVPLSNIFSNRLDNFVDNFNKEDVISHCQNWNATSPSLLAIEKNRVVSHSEIEKRVNKRNRFISYSKVKAGAIEKNRIICCSEIEKGIEVGKRDMFDVSFFYWGIIKSNLQRKKKIRSQIYSWSRKNNY